MQTAGWQRWIAVALASTLTLLGGSLAAQDSAGGSYGSYSYGEEPKIASDAENHPANGTYAYAVEESDEYQATRPYRVRSQTLYEPQYAPEGEYRQPVSIVFPSESQAIVATKLSGQLIAVGWPDRTVKIVHHDPQASFGDMQTVSTDRIAVADNARECVTIFRSSENGWNVETRLDAPGTVDCLVWDTELSCLVATGRWSQRLYRWSFDPKKSTEGRWDEREHVDLPMCGGQALLLPKHNSVLVVDSFGRNYVVVSRDEWRVTHQSEVYGHNVTSLHATEDEERIFFPHQLINEYARSVRTDITWGGLMSNNIRWLQTERVLHENGRDVFRQGRFFPLGTPGNGAGDPSSMAVSSAGRVAITLAGTNRVSIGKETDKYFQQVDVGFRPVDCVYAPGEEQLVVVNQFSDSLSIVDLESMQVDHLVLGALRPPTQIEIGEQAFFNSRISHDGWMSCHSCHSQGHSNGQLNDNHTDKSFGTPKRVLSLLGQAKTMPYSWGGAIESLEQQVEHSILSTMASNSVPSEQLVEAIASYVRSLPQAPSVLHARSSPEERQFAIHSDMIAQGKSLFTAMQCNDCHNGDQGYTTASTYDVGLYDEDSMREFNPPSLLAISQRQTSLLHDGSAKSLRDVIADRKHQLPRPLTEEEQEALISFLQSL